LASVGAAVRGDLARLDDEEEVAPLPTHPHGPHHGHRHDHGHRVAGHDHHADGHTHDSHHTHDGHRHDHDDAHEVGHGHGHGHDHAHGGGHDHDDHDHRGGGGHRHGLFGHRHRVDWERVDLAGPLGWRALATLGLSGGMVPSASAVIVLLGAVQVGRLPFGAALIIAFGLGLSTALVGVGLGVVAVTRHTRRYLDTHALAERFSRLITPLAAVALLAVGAWLAYRALGRV
jgi:ABC-type nickel/cobalt efflux system permease component RcnA